jgi:ABC-type antimicrobial peptide transport system, ATPase component
MVEIKNISKSYKTSNGKSDVLKNVTLSIEKGEIVVILGRSGSGKSTLLNIIGGLLYPDFGNVTIDGTDLYKMSDKERAKLRNEKIGFVFQKFNLIEEMTVLNNIRLPFDIAKKGYNEKMENEIINMLGIGKKLQNKPSTLSGGEQQRVAIARALIKQPEIILADEPTGSLDINTRDSIINFFDESNLLFNQTFIIVTHDLEWVNIADRVFKTENGELYEQNN